MKILKFSASWCQPCRHMSNIIFDLPEEYRLLFKEIDTDSDEGEELASKYYIRNLPTLIVLDDNDKEIDRVSGTKNKDQLIDLINKNK